jgi:hypothetical protein
MQALQEAGFPVFNERQGRETVWKLNATPFKRLADLGPSLAELCSLSYDDGWRALDACSQSQIAGAKPCSLLKPLDARR